MAKWKYSEQIKNFYKKMNSKISAAAVVLFCKMTTKRKQAENEKILFKRNKCFMCIPEFKRKHLTVILLWIVCHLTIKILEYN